MKGEGTMARTKWKAMLAMGSLFAAFAAGTALAAAQAKEESYQWSAELVAFDETARTMTLKTMVVGDATKQAATFKPGDKVLLTWSGIDKYASAINGVHRYEGAVKSDSRFAFPAEFVSFTSNMYLTFKAPVPADAVTRLKTIKPTQWVTATSRHGAAAGTPIAAIRGYNDPEPNS
jgi:hypothetical protein